MEKQRTRKLGIALTTFNGMRYLNAQLDSIKAQTRLPDELVIGDDGSNDDTAVIIDQFVKSASFPVVVLPSSRKLGPCENFFRVIEACQTEYVALSDQDDIWCPDKLAICEEAIDSNGANLLIHSVHEFREAREGQLHKISTTFVPDATIDGLSLAPHAVYLGMSMVAKRSLFSLRNQLCPPWESYLLEILERRPVATLDHWSHMHDIYALNAARYSGKITFVNKPLAYHRNHCSNYSNSAPWEQPQDARNSWPESPERGYRLLSAHCKDMACGLDIPTLSELLLPMRALKIQEFYLRWASIWRDRQDLHAEISTFSIRNKMFLSLCSKGAYRGRFRGGLGSYGMIKDSLRCAGLI